MFLLMVLFSCGRLFFLDLISLKQYKKIKQHQLRARSQGRNLQDLANTSTDAGVRLHDQCGGGAAARIIKATEKSGPNHKSKMASSTGGFHVTVPSWCLMILVPIST